MYRVRKGLLLSVRLTGLFLVALTLAELLAGCGDKGSDTITTATGKQVSLEKVCTQSLKETKEVLDRADNPAGDPARNSDPASTGRLGPLPAPVSGFTLYKAIYETVDPQGKTVQVSGALTVPDKSGSYPLLSYQHPTRYDKAGTADGGCSDRILSTIGSLGYVALLPDYIGYGESYRAGGGYHPYIHAQTLAASVIDLIKAVKEIAGPQGISLNGQLFLTGYSEGGYATMAAVREIEKDGALTVTASAPGAGPYDLSGTAQTLLAKDTNAIPDEITFVLWAYSKIYGFMLTDKVREPYLSRLDGLFLCAHCTSSEVITGLSTDLTKLFTPLFLTGFRGSGQTQLKTYLEENNLYGWKPLSPMGLYHCKGDKDIPFASTQKTYDSFVRHGATQVTLEARDYGGHDDCALPVLLDVAQWFGSLKK